MGRWIAQRPTRAGPNREDELVDKVEDWYSLVLVAAQRARQINEYTASPGLNGSLPGPQVHTHSRDPLNIAFKELRAGKIKVVR
jgi:DNA-directed RNA polymerase subunit omega